MMASLTLLLLGNTAVAPFLAGSEIVAAAGVLVFAANIFLNVKPGSLQPATRTGTRFAS